MQAVKLGYIDYLNSLPVYYGLETRQVPLPPGVELVKAPPTTLNAQLASGALHVSPVSSFAYAQHADQLELLPGLSINSTGFVHSVSLFFRNGVESLRGGKVCVTGESATSVVLLKILMQERLGLDCAIVQGDADLEEIGHSCDGVLLIGDSALRASLAYPNLGRIDLADEWTRWTGTPMVFAVWAARRDFARDEPEALRAIHRTLLAGKAWGKANRAQVVEHARRKLFLSRAFMERYFRDLNYDLDAPKLAGLARYFELARKVGEIPRVPPLTPLEVSP
jgi:chorismate dehydratase